VMETSGAFNDSRGYLSSIRCRMREHIPAAREPYRQGAVLKNGDDVAALGRVRGEKRTPRRVIRGLVRAAPRAGMVVAAWTLHRPGARPVSWLSRYAGVTSSGRVLRRWSASARSNEEIDEETGDRAGDKTSPATAARWRETGGLYAPLDLFEGKPREGGLGQANRVTLPAPCRFYNSLGDDFAHYSRLARILECLEGSVKSFVHRRKRLGVKLPRCYQGTD
jgi:hypothetical protein